MRIWRFNRARAAALASILALAALSACSSIGSGAGNNSSAAVAGASLPANVVAAKKVIAEHENRPASIPLSVPINKPIPSGKTIVFINDATGTMLNSQVVSEAGAILGWHTELINTDGSPQQIQNAWTQILREKPDGVVYSSVPREEINADLLQAQRDGIFVAACCITDPPTDGIDYVIDNAAQAGTYGPLMASWVVANSNGAPKTLYVNVPAPALAVQEKTFEASFAQQAPHGSLAVLNVPFTAMGVNSSDLIVSYLRSHPNIDSLVLSYDGLEVGLPDALTLAGIKNLDIIGEGGTTVNYQYVGSGQVSAEIPFDAYDVGYSEVDALARHFAGVPQVPSYNPLLWILTKNNIPSVSSYFPLVVGIQSQFEKLWGKG